MWGPSGGLKQGNVSAAVMQNMMQLLTSCMPHHY